MSRWVLAPGEGRGDSDETRPIEQSEDLVLASADVLLPLCRRPRHRILIRAGEQARGGLQRRQPEIAKPFPFRGLKWANGDSVHLIVAAECRGGIVSELAGMVVGVTSSRPPSGCRF